MSGAARPDSGGSSYFGLYPAIVTDIVDPDSLGRIEVKFPWLGETDVRAWATLLTPYADNDQGFEMPPSVDTQVVVGFEAGDPRRPYIVGACWNGVESQPEAPAAPNNKRLIKSRSGSLLEFNDTDGASQVTLSMRSGHRLLLDDAAQEVSLSHSNGCVIRFDVAGNVTITGLASVTVDAPAGMTVNAPTTTFSGNVNCQTLRATEVNSPVYTQGAGNFW
jgi:uncharacterized protein involved in type VI secretion and phage assembly